MICSDPARRKRSMAGISTTTVLRYIRTLVPGEAGEGQSDQHLLDHFVSQRDESAFAALLQRHGPMAMGVCLRILHDNHLAEDAFQATFLVLVLRAGAIRKRASVASWLHGVAVRMARKRKAQARRGQLPAVRLHATEPCRDSSTAAAEREEHELLDRELQRLPDKYRLPLLLCYFEGLTQEEAAAQLGWTAGKLKGLLERGRERLRFRLTRRGVALAAAASATMVAPLSAAVPPGLGVGTAQAALNVVSGKT